VHAHDNARLVFVLNGTLEETYEDDAMLCSANSFSFHPAIQPHRNGSGTTDTRVIIIETCSSRGRQLLPIIGADVAPFATPSRRLRSTALELSRALRGRDDMRALSVESMTLELVARASRLIAQRCDPRPRPRFLDDACSFIDAQLHRALTLREVASAMRVSIRQLSDALRVHELKTFRAFVRERRIARARALLADRAISISDVALTCGFCDQSHLTRVFRHVTGLTPLSWRDQLRTQSDDPF